MTFSALSSKKRIATALLVVVQIALTVVLLFGAGLMLKTFSRLQDLPFGVDPDGVLTFRTTVKGDDNDVVTFGKLGHLGFGQVVVEQSFKTTVVA